MEFSQIARLEYLHLVEAIWRGVPAKLKRTSSQSKPSFAGKLYYKVMNVANRSRVEITAELTICY